jgi:hypothetical protein
MLPTRKPICPAVLDQTLARGVFRLKLTLANDPYLLIALRVGFELVLRRPIETAAFTRH